MTSDKIQDGHLVEVCTMRIFFLVLNILAKCKIRDVPSLSEPPDSDGLSLTLSALQIYLLTYSAKVYIFPDKNRLIITKIMMQHSEIN